MKRTAIYSEDRERRVISVPNQLWRLQERGKLPEGKTANVYDAWFNRGPAQPFEQAKLLLEHIPSVQPKLERPNAKR